MASEQHSFQSFRTRDIGRMLNAPTQTIREAIKRGDLPAFRLGKTLRVRRDDLEAFVSRRLGKRR